MDFTTLEFDKILEKLSDYALSEAAKKRCIALAPAGDMAEALRRLKETSQAKNIIKQTGSPPVAVMSDLEKIMSLLRAEAVLSAEQISKGGAFLISCRRMKDYLKRAEASGEDIAFYGNSIKDLPHLEEEITRSINHGQIEDRASQRLYDLRRSIEKKGEQIKSRAEALLQKHKKLCSDGFVSLKNGRYTLPLKKEHRNKIPGVLVELSNTGSTCFIEPAQVQKLQDELGDLRIEEDNEIRTILYTLSALLYDEMPALKLNMEAMETLDFLFAKAKLSMDMQANEVRFTEDRDIRLLSARHPLLNRDTAIPLDFALGGGISGIIITGPNTGGKTVSLKTVGLLSLMAQSGLHIPADTSSSLCIFDKVLCDIGDGQSISENLSTFSSHMTNIIGILENISPKSLVLLDELGSGTDPAEGMGIALSIIEELLNKDCFFTVTTHYPEIKDFAAHTAGVQNARMAFDRESLMPLYRLEIGEAGESCALHIAQRLGMPASILKRAREVTYAGALPERATPVQERLIQTVEALEAAEEVKTPEVTPRSHRFQIGDSVIVYPQKEIGIVYQTSNAKGEIGVQIRKQKRLIGHKRIKLKVAAAELYPDDYDFSIIFDSVENRKARRVLDKRHEEGVMVRY